MIDIACLPHVSTFAEKWGSCGIVGQDYIVYVNIPIEGTLVMSAVLMVDRSGVKQRSGEFIAGVD